MALSLALFSLNVSAQCYAESQQQTWLQKAEASKPVLNITTHHPVREVKIVQTPMPSKASRLWKTVISTIFTASRSRRRKR